MTWRMRDSKMWTLGQFTPTLEDTEAHGFWHTRAESVVRIDLLEFLTPRVHSKIDPYEIDVRSPANPASLVHLPKTEEVRNWHVDGSRWDREHHMIIWSNGAQSEILDPETETIYQPAPGEVLLFDNGYFMHRTPKYVRAAQRETRWFARARFPMSARLENHPDVFRLTL